MLLLNRHQKSLLVATALLALPGLSQASWTVDNTALAGRCALVSPSVTIDDGHGETRIQLLLDREQLLVTTDSNIDNTMSDLGLQVDEQAFVGITEVRDETNVVFGKETIDSIIDQFVPGGKVVLHLRFWPTWPTTGIKNAEFSLSGFTKALKALSQCQ